MSSEADQSGILARSLPGRRERTWYPFELILYRLAAGEVQLCLARTGASIYIDTWCYRDHSAAERAVIEWDGTGEPQGWTLHPRSGRRRPDGDPAREYVLGFTGSDSAHVGGTQVDVAEAKTAAADAVQDVEATAPEQPPVLDTWAIVELMGHRTIAGRVRDSHLAGVPMLRVDFPGYTGVGATTYVRPENLYALTPVSKEIALRVLARYGPTVPPVIDEFPDPPEDEEADPPAPDGSESDAVPW